MALRNLLVIWILFSLMGCQTKFAEQDSARYWLDKAGEASYGSEQWLEYLNKAIAVDPDMAEAHYRKAVMLLRRSNYILGMHSLNRAVELDPHAYINYRGLIKLHDFHDFEGAAADFQQAIALEAYYDPVISESAFLRLSIAQKEMGLYEEALKTIEQYFAQEEEESVSVYAYIYRGLIQKDIGDLNPAMHSFEAALRNWGKCPEAHYQIALLAHQTGDLKRACRSVQKAMLYQDFIRTNPSRPYINQLYSNDLDALFDQVCE